MSTRADEDMIFAVWERMPAGIPIERVERAINGQLADWAREAAAVRCEDTAGQQWEPGVVAWTYVPTGDYTADGVPIYEVAGPGRPWDPAEALRGS